MLYLISLISLLSLIHHAKANFNMNPTSVVLGAHVDSNGTQIVISPDQLKIAVGFGDGTLKIFDTTLNLLCESQSNNASSIMQMVWLPSFGPVTLGISSDATIWGEECQIINTLNFNNTAKGITWNQIEDDNSTIGILAVNFDDRIEEYDVETGEMIVEYLMPQNQTCLKMVYNVEGEEDEEVTILFVSTTGPAIRKFETENGTEIDSFDVESSVLFLENMEVHTGNLMMGMTENNQVLKITFEGETVSRGLFPKSVAMAICPSTKQFALAHATQSVGIYLYTGQEQQTFTSLFHLPQDIDCSSTYLVAVDKSGYVYVYTHEDFKSWVIAIIGGVLGGLVLLVIGVFVFIKLKAKWALEASMLKYGGNMKKYPNTKQKDSKNKSQSAQTLNASSLQITAYE